MSGPEAAESFDCFGTICSVRVGGIGAAGSPNAAVANARRRLESWHDEFTRFDPGSALSRLNADPAESVAAGPVMRRLARAIVAAGEQTGGLVDGTLTGELEAAGYSTTLDVPVPLREALAAAPPRAPAAPGVQARWRGIAIDDDAGTITRPPGVRIDSGGLAKGMFADVLAGLLKTHRSFAVDCGGDVRIGGSAGLAREIQITSPFDRGVVLHSLRLASGGVATSGIGRRSWLAADGSPAHHLLDPSTGRPAYTGVVQVTAMAPTALQAEIRAKAALLSGPAKAADWLPDGGVVVLEDGTARVLP